MKTQEQRIGNRRHGRFEADLEASVDALFRRCPTLCGFSVRSAAQLSRDGFAFHNAGELLVTEVSVYPLIGLEAPGQLCDEIVATLLDLIDKCPGACALLPERTFARVFH